MALFIALLANKSPKYALLPISTETLSRAPVLLPVVIKQFSVYHRSRLTNRGLFDSLMCWAQTWINLFIILDVQIWRNTIFISWIYWSSSFWVMPPKYRVSKCWSHWIRQNTVFFVNEQEVTWTDSYVSDLLSSQTRFLSLICNVYFSFRISKPDSDFRSFGNKSHVHLDKCSIVRCMNFWSL